MTTSFEADRIAILDLADDLHVNKQWIFKICTRLGIQSIQRREPSRKNQNVATVTASEADAIRSEVLRSVEGRGTGSGQDATGPVINYPDDIGFFYVIQLEPDHDPARFKVGFTMDLDARLRKHRTSAPYARLLSSWRAKRTWERSAIDCMTDGCEQLHTEVFRAHSLDKVTARGDAFFGMMPRLTLTLDDDARDGQSPTG